MVQLELTDEEASMLMSLLGQGVSWGKSGEFGHAMCRLWGALCGCGIHESPYTFDNSRDNGGEYTRWYLPGKRKEK